MLQKNKIELTDYPHMRDIENRLLMAELSANEVEILQEILNFSLKFITSHFADSLNFDRQELVALLDKLSKVKLIQRSGELVTVDKDLRKYYAAHIAKFDEEFEPGMEFLQSLLAKVPIHTLPQWYAISKTSDHIFHSIIEKYLQTPKIFERYFQDLEFDDPKLKAICRDVFSAPDFKLSSQDIMKKYQLSHECFEKAMLLLEFNLLCCITYEKEDDQWKEIVTPFYEYRQYLRFMRDTAPRPVKEVSRMHPSDFGFVTDLLALVQAIGKAPIPVETNSTNIPTLLFSTAKAILPHLTQTSLTPSYLSSLVDRLLYLQLANLSGNKLCKSTSNTGWLSLPIQEQALSLYRLPPAPGSLANNFSDKDMREVEKALRPISHCGWILFDAFVSSMTVQVGSAEAVNLRCKGKKWQYAIPSYSQEEKDFVQALICGKFFETGMVAIGFHKDALCFTVTPLGRIALGE